MVSRHTDPRRYNYLVTKCHKLSKAAEVRGVSRRRAVRDFKFWCEVNGQNPEDYFIRGYFDTGYYVPREFLRWWDRVLSNQGRLSEPDAAALEELKQALDEFIPRLDDVASRLKRFNPRLAVDVETLVVKARLLRRALNTVGGDAE